MSKEKKNQPEKPAAPQVEEASLAQTPLDSLQRNQVARRLRQLGVDDLTGKPIEDLKVSFDYRHFIEQNSVFYTILVTLFLLPFSGAVVLIFWWHYNTASWATALDPKLSPGALGLAVAVSLAYLVFDFRSAVSSARADFLGFRQPEPESEGGAASYKTALAHGVAYLSGRIRTATIRFLIKTTATLVAAAALGFSIYQLPTTKHNGPTEKLGSHEFDALESFARAVGQDGENLRSLSADNLAQLGDRLTKADASLTLLKRELQNLESTLDSQELADLTSASVSITKMLKQIEAMEDCSRQISDSRPGIERLSESLATVVPPLIQALERMQGKAGLRQIGSGHDFRAAANSVFIVRSGVVWVSDHPRSQVNSDNREHIAEIDVAYRLATAKFLYAASKDGARIDYWVNGKDVPVCALCDRPFD